MFDARPCARARMCYPSHPCGYLVAAEAAPMAEYSDEKWIETYQQAWNTPRCVDASEKPGET